MLQKKLGVERKAVENILTRDRFSLCIDFGFRYDGSEMKFHFYEEKKGGWCESGIYGSRFSLFSFDEPRSFAIKANSDEGYEWRVKPRVGKETSFLNILEASVNDFKKLPKLEPLKIE